MSIPEPICVTHTVASIRGDHGGPSRSVSFLCRALAQQGVVVRLVTTVPQTREPDVAPILPGPGVELHAASVSLGPLSSIEQSIRFYRTLQTDVAEHVPAVLHDHGVWLPTNAVAAFTAMRHSRPLVISTKGMLTPWALQHHRWKKYLVWWAYQRWALQQATIFHATADVEVDALRELGLEQPVAVIPHGVPLPSADELQPEPRKRREKRKALFLSRLHPKKGIPMLLEAWGTVQPAGWELVLVGPDENGHRAALEQQAQALGIYDALRFVGSVPDDQKWTYYQEADLFVLPTYSENFGIVIAEALAAGVPVLTTTGAPWGELEAHDCGWWVEPKQQEITKALREALGASDATRAAMGARGRTLVREHYAWDEVASSMHGVYQWLLGAAPQPSCVRAT